MRENLIHNLQAMKSRLLLIFLLCIIADLIVEIRALCAFEKDSDILYD
jgi:hypothetical protein